MKRQFSIALLVGFMIVVVATTPLIAAVRGMAGFEVLTEPGGMRLAIGAILATILYAVVMIEIVRSIGKGVYRE